MKKYHIFSIIIILSLSFISVKATDFTSRTGPTTCFKMTYTMSGTVATFIRVSIPNDLNLRDQWYNETNLTISTDGTFTVPNDGNKYWVVPFDGSKPVLMQIGGNARVCECFASGNCKVVGIGCAWDGCNECHWATKSGGTGGILKFKGGAVFIKASSIVIN